MTKTEKQLRSKYYPKDLLSHARRTCGCGNAKRVLEANRKIQENINKNGGQLIGKITV